MTARTGAGDLCGAQFAPQLPPERGRPPVDRIGRFRPAHAPGFGYDGTRSLGVRLGLQRFGSRDVAHQYVAATRKEPAWLPPRRSNGAASAPGSAAAAGAAQPTRQCPPAAKTETRVTNSNSGHRPHARPAIAVVDVSIMLNRHHASRRISASRRLREVSRLHIWLHVAKARGPLPLGKGL